MPGSGAKLWEASLASNQTDLSNLSRDLLLLQYFYPTLCFHCARALFAERFAESFSGVAGEVEGFFFAIEGF